MLLFTLENIFLLYTGKRTLKRQERVLFDDWMAIKMRASSLGDVTPTEFLILNEYFYSFFDNKTQNTKQHEFKKK